MDTQFLNRVAEETIAYASEYKCDLAKALIDWEGDGPNGSWGLTRHEEYIVAEKLGIAEEFSISEEY
tara:strand:+ start:140 stop:340 length:201 start_codon:yes stop_codon:yes gene_type:complete